MTGRSDRASRRIAASPDAIYGAWIDPVAQAQWLPPPGMTARFDRFEPRVGGHYRMTLTYTEGGHGKTSANADTVSGRFVELVPGKRIVQTTEFESDDPLFAGTMTMTWDLRAVDGGTAVTVTAMDVPPGITAADHAEGLNATLANLAAFVE